MKQSTQYLQETESMMQQEESLETIEQQQSPDKRNRVAFSEEGDGEQQETVPPFENLVVKQNDSSLEDLSDNQGQSKSPLRSQEATEEQDPHELVQEEDPHQLIQEEGKEGWDNDDDVSIGDIDLSQVSGINDSRAIKDDIGGSMNAGITAQKTNH